MFNDKPEERGSTASALARSAAVKVLFAPSTRRLYFLQRPSRRHFPTEPECERHFFSEHGGPGVIRIAEAEAPEPAPSEIRVAVRAAIARQAGVGPLKDAQRRVDEWISQFEEGYWPPLVNLARLMEEVGELARLVNHRFGTKPKKPEESEQEMAEELADVLFVILCMANEQGIDLDEAFYGVMEKYRLRDGERWVRKVE